MADEVTTPVADATAAPVADATAAPVAETLAGPVDGAPVVNADHPEDYVEAPVDLEVVEDDSANLYLDDIASLFDEDEDEDEEVVLDDEEDL